MRQLWNHIHCSWDDTYKSNEMKAFLGLCILRGIVSKPRISMYWPWDSFYYIFMFGKVMTRKRLQLLQASLISKTPKTISTIQIILTEIDFSRSEPWLTCSLLYATTRTSNGGWKYGISIRADCFFSNISKQMCMIWNQDVWTCHSWWNPTWFPDLPEQYLNKSHSAIWTKLIVDREIPLTMIDTYLDRGHNLTIDNWHTTPSLMIYLLQWQAKVIETVRFRRTFLKNFPQGQRYARRNSSFQETQAHASNEMGRS